MGHNSMTIQQLPTELVDSCVKYYLEQKFGPNLCGKSCEHPKPTWSSVGPLSLASRRLRHLSLERWFSIAVFSNGKTIGQLHGTPYSSYYDLVRSIYLTKQSNLFSYRDISWSLFQHLSYVHLDGLPVPISQLHYVPALPTVTTAVTGCHLGSDLWSDIRTISRVFLNVRELRLGWAETWCSYCHLSCPVTYSAPEPLIYAGGDGLPKHFGRLLVMCTKMESLTITITHTHNPTVPRTLWRGWSGECPDCEDQYLCKDEIRTPWIANKSLESEGYARLPSLNHVEWRVMFDARVADFLETLWGEDEDDTGSLDQDVEDDAPHEH